MNRISCVDATGNETRDGLLHERAPSSAERTSTLGGVRHGLHGVRTSCASDCTRVTRSVCRRSGMRPHDAVRPLLSGAAPNRPKSPGAQVPPANACTLTSPLELAGQRMQGGLGSTEPWLTVPQTEPCLRVNQKPHSDVPRNERAQLPQPRRRVQSPLKNISARLSFPRCLHRLPNRDRRESWNSRLASRV